MAVSVDYFGPLPVTPRGNTYISRFTDRFSRRADMFPATAAGFSAEGRYSQYPGEPIQFLMGVPAHHILSDNGLQFCSKLHELYMSRWACASLLQAPIIPTVTEALSG